MDLRKRIIGSEVWAEHKGGSEKKKKKNHFFFKWEEGSPCFLYQRLHLVSHYDAAELWLSWNHFLKSQTCSL